MLAPGRIVHRRSGWDILIRSLGNFARLKKRGPKSIIPVGRSLAGASVLSRDLRQYVALHYSGSLRRNRSGTNGAPGYWQALPIWLAKKWLPMKPRKRFLRDVVLGQRMLYLAFRIQDDLFDSETKANSLIFASDRLLIDAEAIFARYFPKDSKFWKIYRDCLRTTAESIVEVDRLQKTSRTNPNRLLDCHAKVCSLFKISSAAVCARSKQWRHFPRVSLFCDEMAKAGQIIDDLTDIQEDLERKRYNYAANILYHSVDATGKQGSPMKRIAQGYTLGDGLKRIFREVYRHVAVAQKAIRPLKIPEADRHVSGYKDLVSRIENEFARSRVEAFFGPILGK